MKQKNITAFLCTLFTLCTLFLSSWSLRAEQKLIVSNVNNKEKEAIQGKMISIQKCYTNELKNTPGIEGKVILDLDYSDLGNVIFAKIDSTTLNNKNVENCLISIFKSIKFPSAPKGKTTNIVYPIIFKQQ